MKTPKILFSLATLLTPIAGMAEDVTLPAPVLKMSFYIFLAFAVCVAVGVFFLWKRKDPGTEPISSLTHSKGRTPESIAPGTSVSDAVRRMNAANIGALLVMDNDRLLGIFTERDALTRVLGRDLDPSSTPVAPSPGWLCTIEAPAWPDTALEDALTIVTHERVRHLPVVEDGRVVGIVSSGDLTHRLVADRHYDPRQLIEVVSKHDRNAWS